MVVGCKRKAAAVLPLRRYTSPKLKNANVLLPDNTLATLNTKENEEVELTTHKSIQDKKITNDYNLIRGSVEITHNNKTNYYVIDKNEFYSYISFETEHSNERVNVTNIKGKNILKDGVDISDNKAELEKLASYFVALLNDDNKTVAAVDLLVPGSGELMGGSQREERLDVLTNRMDELKMNKEELLLLDKYFKLKFV